MNKIELKIKFFGRRFVHAFIEYVKYNCTQTVIALSVGLKIC